MHKEEWRAERTSSQTASKFSIPHAATRIRAAIDATDGDAIAVSEAATRAAHDRLSASGFHVEPTCATATAALSVYRDRGVLDSDDDVVVALTGRNA